MVKRVIVPLKYLTMKEDKSKNTNSNPAFRIGGDLTVKRLGYGAMRLTGKGVWGWPDDKKSAYQILRRVIEMGINLIDTADAYGPEVSELLIAEALYPYPDGLVIATKGGLTRPGPGKWVPNGQPDYLTKCVEKSLQRLQVERIDLYQLHRIDPKVPVEDSLGALKALQDAGKIRHVGLSEVKPREIERARKVLPIVSVQNEYNIANRKSEETLRYCEKEDIGFIPWFPVGGGDTDLTRTGGTLAKEAERHGVSVTQLALAWLLQHSTVILPIPGTSSLAHLEENMASVELTLTPEEWKRIEGLALGFR